MTEARRQRIQEGKQSVVGCHFSAPDYFVHPTAVVDEGAMIGKGTKVWHFSHVMKGAQIGSAVFLARMSTWTAARSLATT